jgi:hypothetical protein
MTIPNFDGSSTRALVEFARWNDQNGSWPVHVADMADLPEEPRPSEAHVWFDQEPGRWTTDAELREQLRSTFDQWRADSMPAHVDPTLSALVARADAHFAACDMFPVNGEQLECLQDSYRTDEALDMVDDWSARLGLPDDLFDELCEWIEGNRGVDDDSRSNGNRR